MVYNSYSEYRQAWEKANTEDPPVPLNLDIELSSICNLACGMCYWGDSDFSKNMLTRDPDGKSKKRFMPKDTAFRLIDEAAEVGIPALKFNFRGESTLHPDYSEIVQYATLYGASLKNKPYIQWKKKNLDLFPPDHLDIGLMNPFLELLANTNANCLDKAIDGLMACTRVMVSLDSTVLEIYKQIRVGGNMGRAFEVIRELKRRKHPNLWVRRVITKINKDEPFVDRVKELFGEDTKVSEHFTFDRNHYQHLALENDHYNWERIYCVYPSQRLVVMSNGEVVACCVAWNGETKVGEWPKQGLMEIWNGEPIKRLRASLRGNRLDEAPELCRNCTSYMAYKRPERAFVKDVEGKAVLS